MRQKGILLTFVEAVNFVHEEDSPAPGIAVLPRALDRFADLFHAGRNCRDAFNVRVRIAGDHFGKRGFACAGWPPEDHRVKMPGLNGARQWLTGSQQVLLADILR